MAKAGWDPEELIKGKRIGDQVLLGAPPCPFCKHWNPCVVPEFPCSERPGRVLKCCHAFDQATDFSCFEIMEIMEPADG